MSVYSCEWRISISQRVMLHVHPKSIPCPSHFQIHDWICGKSNGVFENLLYGGWISIAIHHNSKRKKYSNLPVLRLRTKKIKWISKKDLLQVKMESELDYFHVNLIISPIMWSKITFDVPFKRDDHILQAQIYTRTSEDIQPQNTLYMMKGDQNTIQNTLLVQRTTKKEWS